MGKTTKGPTPPADPIEDHARIAIWGMNKMIEQMQDRRGAPYVQRLDMVMRCMFHYLTLAAPLWSKTDYRASANDN